jgi:hypothetical protein
MAEKGMKGSDGSSTDDDDDVVILNHYKNKDADILDDNSDSSSEEALGLLQVLKGMTEELQLLRQDVNNIKIDVKESKTLLVESLAAKRAVKHPLGQQDNDASSPSKKR